MAVTRCVVPRPGPTFLTNIRPPLPRPRGPLTKCLFEHLEDDPHPFPGPELAGEDPLGDDDLQLALYCCYELHYQGFAGVDDRWEWEPSLLAWRATLEQAVEGALFAQLVLVADDPRCDVEAEIRALIDAYDGPSLSRHMLDEGTIDQMREFAVHRSAYQRKEADPHTWAIPRLLDGPKAALVEIQLDEYGGGVESQMHATLFATTMERLGLDSGYGAYLDLLPGVTLATTNLASLFGLHRRWRGALVGHLAVFETTSVGPMSRYGAALRRFGVGGDAERFYDVHVVADAHHEIVACKALAAGLAAAEPDLAGDILFGAQAIMLVEGRFTQHLLDAWSAGRSSLRVPLASAGGTTSAPG